MLRSGSVRRGLAVALVAVLAFGAAYQVDIVSRVAYAMERGRIQADQDHLATLTSQDVAALETVSKAYTLVANVIRPSVVNIRAIRSADDDGFERELRRRFFGDDDARRPFSVGAGSGVVIDHRGHILTNNHVVGQASRVDVTLADKRKYTAKVIGTDRMTDLAVIKIDATDLHPARLGDSDQMEVGHIVMAVGSPFRLEQTVSHGIISAKGRYDVDGLDIDYQDMLQTDAPINPGNSGGPLVNTRGEVIGINTAIATASGGYQGIGFAIPSNMARTVADQLIEGKSVVRGYLGITIQNLDDVLASKANTPGGAIVSGVAEQGPAAKAGLRSGDVIIRVNDRPIVDRSDLSRFIASLAPGSKARIEVVRDGQPRSLQAEIAKQPDNFSTRGFNRFERGESPDGNEDDDDIVRNDGNWFESLGIEVATLSPSLASRHDVEDLENGALIVDIDPTGHAFASDIRVGDVIVSVDKQRVRNVRDLRRLLTKDALAKGVELTVKNRYGTRYSGLRVR